MPAQIGKYNVEAEVGCGALVKVFHALDRDTGRRVTLKLVTRHADKALVEAFRRDVANAAKLRDPSISAVYELSEHAGLPFAAMQSLDGDNLAQVMQAAPRMTLLQNAVLMWHVGRGLDILHTAGVSAGIRPSGIVPAGDGTVTIQDFGVLRSLPGDEQEDPKYQAPEETAGSSPDPLSDLYSLGSIYFELLTRTTFVGEPGRIREVVPDCPEALENLILRALERRRELRYQSIAELQSDAEPVISDLKRAHSTAMLPAIRELIEADELEKAQDALSDILRIDAANRAATRMRAEVRARLNRKTIAPRILSLLSEADQAAFNGQLEAAVELLRSGLRIDGENTEVKTRLAEMELRLDRARRSADQVREARQLFNDHRLTEARAKLLDALESDPTSRDAPVLLEKIVAAIFRHEAEAKVQRGLHEADALLQAKAFERAIRALEALQTEFPDLAVVAHRLNHARIEKARADRLAWLDADLANARRCFDKEHFAEAVSLLVPWVAEFPENTEVSDLLSVAETSMQRAREAAAQSEEALHEVQLLLENDRPDLAAQLLEEKCAELPGERELATQLSAVQAMLPAWNARRVIHDVLARVAALDQLREPSVALSIIEEALQAYPDSSELAEAAGELRSRVRHQEQQKKLARRWEAIRRRIDAAAWPQALTLLESARAEFPDEPEFETQLALVQERLRQSDCEKVAAEIRQFLADGETDQAGRTLKEALDSFGEAPLLVTVRDELAARKKDDEDLRAAQVLFGRRRFDEAEQLLARLDGRNRPEVRALTETVREARAATEEAQFYETGRDKALKLIQQQEFEQAADLLRNLISLFPDDPILSRQLASAEARIEPAKPAASVEETPAPKPVKFPGKLHNASAPPRTRKVRFATTSGVRWGVMVAASLLLFASVSIVLRQFTRTEARGLPSASVPVPSAAPPQILTTQPPAPIEPPAKTPQPAARRSTAQPPPQPTRPFVAPPAAQALSTRPAPDLPPATDLAVAPGIATSPANLSASIALPAPVAAPPAVESAAKVVDPAARVGGRVEPAKPLRTPAPQIPELAARRAIRGNVQLELVVSAEGAVTHVRTISGDPILVQAAKNAVLAWRYQPATLNGKPVESKAIAHISFEARQ